MTFTSFAGRGPIEASCNEKGNFALILFRARHSDFNVPLSYSIKHIAEHVYRFAWIEACAAAAGTFCEALGIPAQNLSTNNFIAAGIMSRAFLSYKTEQGFGYGYDNPNWLLQSQMWYTFLDDWVSGNGNQSLAALVYDAQKGLSPFPSPYASNSFPMGSAATSLGATDLRYPIQK